MISQLLLFDVLFRSTSQVLVVYVFELEYNFFLFVVLFFWFFSCTLIFPVACFFVLLAVLGLVCCYFSLFSS